MSEQEYIDKIKNFISDIERVRDGHKADISFFNLETDFHKSWRLMHESKAAAYDFVIRKLRRTFNIVNDGKETK